MKNAEQNCHPDRSEAKWRDLLFYSALPEVFFDRAYADILHRTGVADPLWTKPSFGFVSGQDFSRAVEA
jgi:hypothetical protein